MGIRFGICAFAMVFALGAVGASANETPQPLPFAQDWSDASLITVDDDWSNVPGITGFRGRALAFRGGLDPRDISAESPLPNDGVVHANGGGTGDVGVIETTGSNPSIALLASPTASAPYLLLHLDTTGMTEIEVAYVLRDIGVSGLDVDQPVAVQYRVGNTGPFIDLPDGFVADATGPVHEGSSLAPPRVSRVEVRLPPDADDRALVQVRIIASDAPSSDEPIAIDDIVVDSLALRPDLSVAPVIMPEGNAGNTATVTISLNVPAVRAPVTFNVATVDGAATVGDADYVPVALTPMTIPIGASSVTVPITVNGDATYELDESFALRVTDVAGARAIADEATIGLMNDDPSAVPVLAVEDASLIEGIDGDPSLMSFTVRADRVLSENVTFAYRTIAGTANGPGSNDYIAVTNGLGTMPAGASTAPVVISIRDDVSPESDEQFRLGLSSPSANATLGATEIFATGTIIDDDVGLRWRARAPAVEGADGTTTTLVFDVTLSDPIDHDLVFTLNAGGGNATGGAAPPADYLEGGYDGVIPAGATTTSIGVIIFGDDVVEGDQHLGATVLELDPAVMTLTPPGGVTGIIIDDEGDALFRHGFE